jgi:hypothetical protein
MHRCKDSRRYRRWSSSTYLTHGVDDVRSLAGCRALRELKLARSSVTDVGIIGLERIATLEVLNLAHCSHITSVTSLRHCTALRELILDGTSVTDAGIAGLECIVTLTKLSLASTATSSQACPPCGTVLRCASWTSPTRKVTAAGTTGLDEIGTLQCLKARVCSTRCFHAAPLSIIARGRPERLRRDRCRPGRAGRREHAGNLKLSAVVKSVT